MRSELTRLIGRWVTGVSVGTLIIGVTSPWFVRSYLPRRIDQVRGVWTLPPQHVYRWRSEGYADTFIGPLGMPGRHELPADDARSPRIALWGDSQAEGVSVADDLKLYAQIERDCDGQCSLLPLARSGDDAAVWLTQMPAVEQQLGVDAHVILVVDLPDLLSAPAAPLSSAQPADGERANVAIAARLPAFVIQAARNLLTEADPQTPRTLRFSLGPSAESRNGESVRRAEVPAAQWRDVADAIRAATELPVVIVYAPQWPQIIGGRMETTNPEANEFRAMRSAATACGLAVIDMSEPFLDAVKSGIWPRGFQNGYIGSGHLNSDGYRIIAKHVAEAIEPIIESAASEGN